MKSKLTINELNINRWVLPNGDLHREEGPGVYDDDGFKAWWVNGKLHREDGPAIEYSNGRKSWYLNSKAYTEQEYKKKMRLKKLKHII